MDISHERRQHTRFAACRDTIALTPLNFGQVIDMSLGGLRVKYLLRPNDPFQKKFNISLLNKEGDHYIDGLSCQIVTVTDISPFSPNLALFIREVGLKFIGLTSFQKKQLANFVFLNSMVHASLA